MVTVKSALGWIRQNLTTVNIVLTLAIGATAAGGTIVQAWISASQIPPLPQVRASSLSELRIQIQDRQKALQREIQALDALLTDLTRAEAALAGSPSAPAATTRQLLDWWGVSALKTVAVYFVLALSLWGSVFALIGDLIGLILGYDFPLVRGLWHWSWRDITLGWYWQRATPGGVGAGVLLILSFGLIGPLMEARLKRRASARSDSRHERPASV